MHSSRIVDDLPGKFESSLITNFAHITSRDVFGHSKFAIIETTMTESGHPRWDIVRLVNSMEEAKEWATGIPEHHTFVVQELYAPLLETTTKVAGSEAYIDKVNRVIDKFKSRIISYNEGLVEQQSKFEEQLRELNKRAIGSAFSSETAPTYSDHGSSAVEFDFSTAKVAEEEDEESDDDQKDKQGDEESEDDRGDEESEDDKGDEESEDKGDKTDEEKKEITSEDDKKTREFTTIINQYLDNPNTFKEIIPDPLPDDKYASLGNTVLLVIVPDETGDAENEPVIFVLDIVNADAMNSFDRIVQQRTVKTNDGNGEAINVTIDNAAISNDKQFMKILNQHQTFVGPFTIRSIPIRRGATRRFLCAGEILSPNFLSVSLSDNPQEQSFRQSLETGYIQRTLSERAEVEDVFNNVKLQRMLERAKKTATLEK